MGECASATRRSVPPDDGVVVAEHDPVAEEDRNGDDGDDEPAAATPSGRPPPGRSGRAGGCSSRAARARRGTRGRAARAATARPRTASSLLARRPLGERAVAGAPQPGQAEAEHRREHAEGQRRVGADRRPTVTAATTWTANATPAGARARPRRGAGRKKRPPMSTVSSGSGSPPRRTPTGTRRCRPRTARSSTTTRQASERVGGDRAGDRGRDEHAGARPVEVDDPARPARRRLRSPRHPRTPRRRARPRDVAASTS